MTASIDSTTFDCMRGRLSPAASDANDSSGLPQRGENVPLAGTIYTEKQLATAALCVSNSAAYRGMIGDTVNAVINDVSISNVVIIDCRTSYKKNTQGSLLMAEWTLCAPKTWNP